MAANMGSTEFVLQDTAIAHEVEGARVSINVVSENTPPSVPKHNADVIYAWCYSSMYDHDTESKCFHYAKAINQIISDHKDNLEIFYKMIEGLVQEVLNLQFRNANRKLVEEVSKNPEDYEKDPNWYAA